jgi:sugar O-acyltransferase (sialic acid O-acetyltransferase NeuD family)
MSALLILGAGGHGRVVADTAMTTGLWNKISFLDDKFPILKIVNDIPVTGTFNDYQKFINEYDYAFVALGENKKRMYLLDMLENIGYKIPNIIHPNAIISRNTKIANGVFIMAGVILNTGVNIERGVLINTSATVDHDSQLEKGAHIAPGVHICGTVVIGSFTYIYSGSVISNNITIGNNCIVAAGSVVLNNLLSNCMAAGIPAKVKS